MKALWAFIAFWCTSLGLEGLITGAMWLFAPHRLIRFKSGQLNEKDARDLLSKATGRVNPVKPASYLAVGIWLLGIAVWLVWSKVL